MRATVSLMLSHSGGETVMSKPDYEQTALHHGALLVLLRGVGPSKPRSLQRIFDKVRRINNVKVTDSSGVTRDIWVRYIHDYPVENNDWGDFQTHRRLLGLITIGKFENQTELNELCRHHESLKVRYSSTLYDSRALFFGPQAQQENSEIQQSDAQATTNNHHIEKSNMVSKSNDNALSTLKNLQDEFTTPSNFKARAFFYRENDHCLDLESHIAEFIVNALFWVLEAKRLDRAREKVEKVSLLYAPFERRDFVGLDMESRHNRKRCLGRVTKNLADLSLQTGLVEESLGLYHNACETLRAINDSLWVGASQEGLCAASAILLYPHLRESNSLHRNSSLQEAGGSPLKHMPDKWRASDFTKTVNAHSMQFTTQNNQNSSYDTNNSTTAGTANPPNPPPTASSSCSSVSSILTTNSNTSGTSTPTSSSSTSTLSAAAQMQRNNNGKELPGNILKPDEIPSILRKAIIDYSKYRNAAIIETEAALKAARICIEQNRPLDVAMFLQNILYINVSMNEPERVKRFEVITDLYLQIGYRRKAAFFQRLAALKHVQQGNLNPDWSQTYRLMLDSFPGFLLSLDPLEVIENSAGWPSLQIELLQSLIAAARRLGHSALATRHMTFLLQTQWENLSPTDQSEMALQLQNLSAQCEGSPVPLVLENGTVIPPANLTDLPFCMDLIVKDLPAHLRPQRIKIIKVDSGPFLFTPIHFSSIDRRDRKKEKNKIAFSWVLGDLSEVVVRLRNPLPFELIVNDMRLLTNGVVFESVPQTISLQPNVPTMVTLHGTPIEEGQLEIQGYSTHTLGVKSNCRLKHMHNRNFPPNYLVDVIPALPNISVATSLPQTATFSNMSNSDIVVTSASLTLYNGETSTCVVTITNKSCLPVEHLEVLINSNTEAEVQRKIFQINEQEIQSKLPLQPKCSIDFVIKIFGEADFICPLVSQRAASMHSSGTMHTLPQEFGGGGGGGGPQSLQYSNYASSGHASLPSRIGSPNQQQQQIAPNISTNKRNEIANASFRSNISANSNAAAATAAASLTAATTTTMQYAQHVEAQFRIKYSGGAAMEAGFCRQCAISFHLELIPSAQITSWDVLPAEIPSQFYLVLDVSNLTAQEMSLNYTSNKSILIEAKESCRVPIPVERCSLEQIEASRAAEIAENLEKELCFRSPILSLHDSISKLCSEHIAERVKINWLLTGTDIQGIASLRGISLTPSMTDLTTVSPLQWTVLFQDSPVQPQSEILCMAGQPAKLSITVCNQSPQPLQNLTLTVKFYQDYLNGMENFNLETRVALSGPNRVTIPTLEPNSSAYHEYTAIFFTPGRFKTSIQCCSKPQTEEMGTRSSYRAPTMNNINSQLDAANTQIIFTDATPLRAGIGGINTEQEHIWKFIPPIEVTVVEQQ